MQAQRPVKNIESCDGLNSSPIASESGSLHSRIREWIDLNATCDRLLLAGLRREIGSEEELPAAYRRWYANQMKEHDRMLAHLVQRFAQCEGPNAS